MRDWVLPSPFLLPAYKKFGTCFEKFGTFPGNTIATDVGDLWFGTKLRTHLVTSIRV